jgi:hypothetical protein
MSEIKSCPCGCGAEVAESKPEQGDLALESFDTSLRIISMSTEALIELEEAGRVKPLTDYED